MANVLQMPSALRLRCTSCGATTDAACDCGAPYERAGELAAKAVAQFPHISGRALAKQLNIDEKTLRRAARQRDAQIATAANAAVETKARVGADGKERVHPTPRHNAEKPVAVVRSGKPTTSSGENVRSAEPAISLVGDSISQSDADKAIRLIADSIRTCGLFDPRPGIAACMVEAMDRATPDDVAVIAKAADLLGKLTARKI